MKRSRYFDTGAVDSERVQDKHSCFETVMTQLRNAMMKDFTNPFIRHENEKERQCLIDMKSIELVVFDSARLESNMPYARLVQACDVSTIEPNSFEEQITQKNELKGYILHRGTNETERDSFSLGNGEAFSNSKQFELTSTWWSSADKILGGYGDVSALTAADDIICISDVDTKHFWTHLDDNNIDNPYEYNENLFRNIWDDLIVDDANLDEIVPDYYDRFDWMWSVWYKDMVVRTFTDLAKEHNLTINKDPSWENYNQYMKSFTASEILDIIREVNFVYHPWVTVKDIQRHRYYYSDPDQAKEAIRNVELRHGRNNDFRRQYNEELLSTFY